jgi:hypothetical protein
VRNLVRAGVSEKVAMTISGHKTRSVFDRYNIVAQSDLREAARKLETNQRDERKALENSRAPEIGQTLGIVAQKVQQNREVIDVPSPDGMLPN